MDGAAILADLADRNALRQAHGLPLLDVEAEYARLVSVERQREYRECCQQHADEYESIRQHLLAEYGADFANNMGGRWAIGHQTRVRFTAYMADRYSIHPPGRSG